ncbi:MAG TPA: HEAT repeat domain-containing protein, partial [Gemmatimonadales bacterium]|nr:HEAT repeat domain-containing protein [Gemmatimonadales bacterium]
MYPITTVVSFGGLAVPELGARAVRLQLASAVAGHVNYETLFNSLAKPVEAITFNAIPRRFQARVRVMNEGLVYPAGAALGGGLLRLAERFRVSSLQISVAGAGMGLLLVALGHQLGRNYLGALVEMLRSRSVNLEDVSEGLARLPARYSGEVRQLLSSSEAPAQRLGLELASRMDPAQFLTELDALLERGSPPETSGLRDSLVKLCAAVQKQDPRGRVRAMLRSSNEAAREVALEAMIVGRESVTDEELHLLLSDGRPVVRGLAAVAARQAQSVDPALAAEAAARWNELLAMRDDAAAWEAAVRSIRNAGDPRLVPLLKEILSGAGVNLRRQALEALARFAAPGESEAEELALAHAEDPEAGVRAAAVEIVGVVRSDRGLELVARAIEDAHPAVRRKAAEALAGYGERGLLQAAARLGSPRAEVVDAAIAALGGIRTGRAEEVLFSYMKMDYFRVRQNLGWLRRIPSVRHGWGAVVAAIEDLNQRVIRRVLHVLSSLGHEKTCNCVRRILRGADERARADAVMTLASLPHRRFVEPILALLELQTSSSRAPFAGVGAGNEKDN